MITHQNVIANIMQMHTYESVARKALSIDSQVTLGLLPFSHIYGLVPVAHLGAYSGDQCIVLPRFKLGAFLTSVQNFKIQQISIVPPILVQMLSQQDECSKYDISSVRFVYAGAAPLGSDTVRELLKMNSKWKIGQIYGSFNLQLDARPELTLTARHNRNYRGSCINRRIRYPHRFIWLTFAWH